MRIFKDPDYDFLGWRRVAAVLSALVLGVGLGSVVLHGGLQYGIDFAGGSQIILRFAEPPDLTELREALNEQGLEDSAIQEFEEADEILIRTPRVEQGAEGDLVTQINAAVDTVYPPPEGGAERFDLNGVGRPEIVTRLTEANPLGFDLTVEPTAAEERYRQAADAVLGERADLGLFTSWDQVRESGVDERIFEVLRERAYLGRHTVVNSEWVGPQVGEDLRRQAIQAILFALLGMLAYISYRFEFKYGIGAVAALFHDVLIAVGAFSLTQREFDLPVIAAFLTIVGYSLNDSVVVFDRIRENNQSLRRMPFYDRVNLSINQMLSRTVLTSGTTLIVVVTLYLFGGQVINDFAFALLVGVVVGTYSSIFVASPVVYEWQEYDRRKKERT